MQMTFLYIQGTISSFVRLWPIQTPYRHYAERFRLFCTYQAIFRPFKPCLEHFSLVQMLLLTYKPFRHPSGTYIQTFSNPTALSDLLRLHQTLSGLFKTCQTHQTVQNRPIRLSQILPHPLRPVQNLSDPSDSLRLHQSLSRMFKTCLTHQTLSYFITPFKTCSKPVGPIIIFHTLSHPLRRVENLSGPSDSLRLHQTLLKPVQNLSDPSGSFRFHQTL